MVIHKAADVRKLEIVLAAELLFVRQGYDATTINDVLEAVGIAKGTFYHHFASKEAVLEAIIDHHVEQVRERYEQVLATPDLTPHQRILAVVAAANVATPDEGLVGELNKPQNIVMHQLAEQRLDALMVPIITDIVTDGVAQGVFSTQHPREAVELVVTHSRMLDDRASADAREYAERARAFVHHVELLFGADPGSFAFLLDLLQVPDEEGER
ncbi:TetR/AcrR family transcriptional regulator [Aestuariimicrobium ganziense]|uniref:TetR/AcrR family transcriptional regulator n=1 Tax=Aestuariimicrobium ganziense TaxID=2773677 RepID=UPI00194361B2|nr:TetR/AcrR family transcriptional regulator [Aestuariimicrobium ganziense]